MMRYRWAALLTAALALRSPSPAGAGSRECYATIVYGPDILHPCLAAVLGSALRSIDPARPRVALVHNLSAAGGGVIDATWSVRSEMVWRGAAGRKVELWDAPGGCETVAYLDADSFPVTAAVGALFALPGTIVYATPQGRAYENYKHARHCLNGGFLRASRDPGLRDRYARYARTFTRQRGAPSRVDPRQRIGTKSVPCHGTDQGLLNLAVGRNWSDVSPTARVAFPSTCGDATSSDVLHFGRAGLRALRAGRAGWCGGWWRSYADLPEAARAACDASLSRARS